MASEEGGIIITGATGLIGSAVAKPFIGRFEHVFGLDVVKPAEPPPEGFTALRVDITSDDSVQDGLECIRQTHGTKIATVIHLAAYYDFSGEPNPKYEQITVEGSGRLIRTLLEMDFKVEQFIFSSTMLVHKPGEPGLFIDEDWPIEPTWVYPKSKVKTEHLLREKHDGIPLLLLRIAGVYDDYCHSIPLAHQIQRVYERQITSRLYSGAVAHGQSFVHLDDLVQAFAQAVERRAELPAELAILIGEPDVLSYDELQHTIGRLLFGDWKETVSVPPSVAKTGAVIESAVPGGDRFIKPWMIDRASDHYALNIDRARRLLDWEPKRSLHSTLPNMIENLKRDPETFYKINKLSSR